MQRRAAAAYAAFFIALAVGSYAFIAAAHAPAVGIDNPDQRLTEGQSFAVGGTTYTVDSISAPEAGGGGGAHGGGGGSPGSATLTWTDGDATWELSWAAGDEVTVGGEPYVVTVNNSTDPNRLVLEHVVEAPTTEVDGEPYVVINDSAGERDLQPIDEYRTDRWGEDAFVTYENGTTVDFRGNETDVSVGETDATLTWTAPKTKEIRLTAGENTTVGPKTYVAHVEKQRGNAVLLLSTNTEAYAEKEQAVDRFQERINGFWGVSILSGVAAMLVIGMAYMPVRRT